MCSEFRSDNLFIQRFRCQFLQIGQLFEILIHSGRFGIFEKFFSLGDATMCLVVRTFYEYWEGETPGYLMQSSASTLTLPIEPFLADFGFSLTCQFKTPRVSYET